MSRSILEIYNNISVQQYKTDMGFKALVEGVHDNMYVIPEYQRKFRWKKSQVEELAASLIRGLPIPPIYAYRKRTGTDGNTGRAAESDDMFYKIKNMFL